MKMIRFKFILAVMLLLAGCAGGRYRREYYACISLIEADHQTINEEYSRVLGSKPVFVKGFRYGNKIYSRAEDW